MDHLRAGVLVLTVIGKGNGDHLATCLAPLHDDTRVFHCKPAADITVDPADLRVFMSKATLGHQVEHIRAPVLHRNVLDFSVLHCYQFDHCAVQRGGLKLRCRTSLHVGQFGTFINNNERALKLTELLGIDPEISLERMLNFHPRWHVDKAATAEDRTVKR